MLFTALIASLAATTLAAPINGTLAKRGPSDNWSASLSGYSPVPNTAGNPAYHVFPDGHLSSIPSPDGGWQMYWSNAENYRTVGGGPRAEEQTQISPPVPYPQIYFGGRTGKPGYANGGKWLMSVHASPDGNPRHLVAMYHAEDGYWPYQGAGGPSWKSIGVAHSYDNGFTWQDRGQVLTAPGRPSDAEGISRGIYGGIGNHGCVWNGKWMCIFSSNPDHTFGLAVSSDPDGNPGSWTKWDGSGFNSPGLGGGYVALRGISRGSNPSIMFNTVLDKYLVAFNTWDNTIHIAASSDLINFNGERFLVGPTFGAKAWYPSLISSQGSYTGGADLTIYYADGLSPGGDRRQVTKQNLRIARND